MSKQVFFGLLWFVVIYMAVCFLTGAVAGAIAGAQDPANASQAGAIAGSRAVNALHIYLATGSVILSIIGTWIGILPGTGLKKKANSRI